MPIRHQSLHTLNKKPDGSPVVLEAASQELPQSQAADDMLHALNEAYNSKQGKAWGLFHDPSGAYPLSGWLTDYLGGGTSFHEFSLEAAGQFAKLLDESPLSTGGHLYMAHYQQGMTDYLFVALLQEATAIAIGAGSTLAPVSYLDLQHLPVAARINITEWQTNKQSRQYISFIRGKNGRKANDFFRDFIGCQEGVDAPGETRTLLKAFSDFVESEDLPEDSARQKTDTLLNYATGQAKIGQPISLEELSSLIDEDRPKAFFEHIRNKDFGLAPEIPADKKVLNMFRRFTGRAEGLSISFESHLLGSAIEFDQTRDLLIIRQVPTQLKDQLKRKADNKS